MTDRYSRYQRLRFDHPADRVLRITMHGTGPVNAADSVMHRELAEVWREVDSDPDTAAVILRGSGKAFSAGGDFAMIEEMIGDQDKRLQTWREARDIVYNVINCSKPIIAALHGPAVGAGLAAALVADITIAAKSARIIDGHTRLGVAAGDHSAIVWPLLCGMAKSKYYLLTCEALSGEEAERIGLVSLCVEEEELQERAVEIATRLAGGAQAAIRFTKYALNNWLRAAGPIFDASLAMEFMGFTGAEAKEGVASFKEKRAPEFPPRTPI